MSKINAFVESARKKGLSDGDIRSVLNEQGWSKTEITMAVAGLEAPSAPSTGKEQSKSQRQNSLTPLMAALHHILLWFFTGSSVVTITGVVASLSGFDVSTRALAAMIAVTVVTFLPYALLFALYLRQFHHTPELIPGRVWSIITICLHSVGAMAAGITLVVTLIVEGQQSIIISAGLILLLDLIVVAVYSFAAFIHHRPRVRRGILLGYLPLLAVLLGILFTLSVLQLGPARHDQDLRQDLTTAAQSINNYATNNSSLPTSTSQVTSNPDITYQKTSDTTYTLCGMFKANYQNSSSYPTRGTQPRSDSYVSSYRFETSSGGQQCFDFESAPLTNNKRR